MHVRDIVITCNVLIQSERVNTILKYREYRATSTVTEPKHVAFQWRTRLHTATDNLRLARLQLSRQQVDA